MSNSPACNLFTNQKNEIDATAVDSWEEQHKDPEVEKIFRAIAESNPVTPEQYEIVEDSTVKRTSSIQSVLTQKPHSDNSSTLPFKSFSGHGGIFKTYKRLQNVVFWLLSNVA